jgi:aminopeptidase N
MKKILQAILLLLSIINTTLLFAQYTKADTLRGSYGAGRDWWDVLKYDLHVKFNVEDSSVSGYNIIQYKILNDESIMQIDLQEPLVLDSIYTGTNQEEKGFLNTVKKILFKKNKLSFTKTGNAYFITLPKRFLLTKTNQLTVYYHGKPVVAKRPPWDGGMVWAKDSSGDPWISVACQGTGASVWYPCKDHQSDEPDSAEVHITAPSYLVSVSNGKLRNKVDNKDGTSTYSWAVTSPINNYTIIPYIGKYINFSENYKGEKGNLDMDYWVLKENVEKAKTQFKDAPKMMKAFEHWFGTYPFYADGYKLVDAPYLGMEHQSAIAYGNAYKNGYAGTDLSGTGWGMKWDFIIVHESGHEWFGNNITTKDIADMWVHESFTNYSETLFTEYYYGKKAGSEYVIGTRKKIANDVPIVGPYNVNKEGSSDMYYKGGNMIHTIRQVIDDDEKFRKILRGMNQTFYHQTVTTAQVEEYISKQSAIDFSKVFDQYLRTTKIPELEYKIEKGKLFYRWANCIKDFDMPVKVMLFKNKYSFIYPVEKFKQIKIAYKELKIDDNFYIQSRLIIPPSDRPGLRGAGDQTGMARP